MMNDDPSNPFEAPSATPNRREGASASSRRRISPRLIPALLCGFMGLSSIYVVLAMMGHLLPLVSRHGAGPVLAHPIFPVPILFGLSAMAWSVSARAWIRSGWKVALLWTAVSFGLLFIAKTRSEIARQYNAAVAARADQGP